MKTSCGIFIFNPDGKVLICRPHGPSSKHGWTIPKGHVELDENHDDTAIREVAEESNLDLRNLKDSLVDVGTEKYVHGKKQLHAFALRLLEPVNEELLKCNSFHAPGKPEIDLFIFVDVPTAIQKLHYVQSTLLKLYIGED